MVEWFTLEGESFRLKHNLERREVDDKHLSNHREHDGHEEHAVSEQTNREHRLCLQQFTHNLQQFSCIG